MSEPVETTEIRITFSMRAVLLLTLLGTVLTGIFPDWLLGLARAAAVGLG